MLRRIRSVYYMRWRGGELTSDCCGYELDEYVLNAVYKGCLDFKQNNWIVSRMECSNCVYGYYSLTKNVNCESLIDERNCKNFRVRK